MSRPKTHGKTVALRVSEDNIEYWDSLKDKSGTVNEAIRAFKSQFGVKDAIDHIAKALSDVRKMAQRKKPPSDSNDK